MKRTTILADDDLLRRMQGIAQKRKVSFTRVVHEAMESYVASQQPSILELLDGIATTDGVVDYSDGRDEEALREGTHPIYGLSATPNEHD